MASDKKDNVSIGEIKEKVPEVLSRFLSVKNLAIIIGMLAILSFLAISVIKITSNTAYSVLYSHLSPDDAGSILSVLQEEKISYKVEGNGSIILVPKDKVYDVRLKLAAKGLPSGKIVGFEIFDEPKLGITQFQEHIEYIRALEGELQRTINRIDAVWSSKVNIALPKDSVFVRDTEEPKASVILKLWPGKDLNKEQVKAIVFLVSHAVPGLKPENVTVADNRGRVLSELIQEDDTVGDANKEIGIKRQIEREIERKVQGILAKALGSSKVVAKATVEIETGKVEKQSEIYDPDMTAVVSERKIQEKELGVENKTAGVPGTGTNVPPVINNQGAGQVRNSKEKKDTTTNYDVSKTIEKRTAPIFAIKRISVGVLIDGRYKKGNNGTEEFIPRSPEELKTYENLIKSVVGFNDKRGDKVTVVSVPFEVPAQEEVVVAKAQGFHLLYLIIGGVIIVLILGGLVFFLFRRKSKVTGTEVLGMPSGMVAKAYKESVETPEEKMEKERKEIENLDIKADPSYVKILDISREHPELIAHLIKDWLGEKADAKS